MSTFAPILIGSSFVLAFFAALAPSKIDGYFVKEKNMWAEVRNLWSNQTVQYILLSVVFFMFARLFFGKMLAFFAAVGFFLFLKTLWKNIAFLSRRAKLRRVMLENMDAFLNALVSALQSGRGFISALSSSLQYVPEPLKTEIWIISESIDSGKMSIEDALFNFHKKYKLPETRRFVYALSFASKYPGRDLIPILQTMAGTFRTVSQTQEKLSAKTTQIRISLYVLPIMPVVMLLMLNAAMPDAVRLLFGQGRIILFIGLSVIAVAFLWAYNMIAKFAEKE